MEKGRENRVVSPKKRENHKREGCGLLEVEEWMTKGGLMVFQRWFLSKKEKMDWVLVGSGRGRKLGE